MNYLGHLYLSGEDPLVITGNFMADGVKGRELGAYPTGIQRGIRLHRAIDTFTDTHTLTRSGRQRLRAHAGKYAGVALDLIYDHLLAKYWADWHPDPLGAFTERMYVLLGARAALMPERVRRMLPYMVQGDWLSSYASVDGLARALEGLSHRAKGASGLRGAERVLVASEGQFHEEFERFLPELRTHLQAHTYAQA